MEEKTPESYSPRGFHSNSPNLLSFLTGQANKNGMTNEKLKEVSSNRPLSISHTIAPDCMHPPGFRSILTLTYVDKLIDDVHRLFRDKYRTEIQQQSALSLLNGTFDFQNDFLRLLR